MPGPCTNGTPPRSAGSGGTPACAGIPLYGHRGGERTFWSKFAPRTRQNHYVGESFISEE
ncbi:hypothetical protein GCM10009551_002190 [Nocardiopsis tropica]